MIKQEGRLEASIILRQPISVDEAIQWVTRYNLSNASFRLRFIEKDGTRGTMGMATDENGDISVEDITEMTRELDEASPEFDLKGVVTIEAAIEPAQWHRLSRLPNVFMVDITAAFAKQHFAKQSGATLKEENNLTVTAYSYPIYWYLEDN